MLIQRHGELEDISWFFESFLWGPRAYMTAMEDIIRHLIRNWILTTNRNVNNRLGGSLQSTVMDSIESHITILKISIININFRFKIQDSRLKVQVAPQKESLFPGKAIVPCTMLA